MPAAPLPRVVVFDVGRVLVEWDPDRVYSRLIPDPAARSAFFDRVGLDRMNEEADRNGSLEAHVTDLARDFPDDADLIYPWWRNWGDMCWAEKSDTADVLRGVKSAGFPVWALSNFARDTFDIARTLYPVLADFDGLVVSGDVGTIKPEPEIYRILEERTGLSGPDLFFIDDKEENIIAAEQRGWRGHLFTDAETLASHLNDMGIRWE